MSVAGSTQFPWSMLGVAAAIVGATSSSAYLIRFRKGQAVAVEAAKSAAMGTATALSAWEIGWYIYRWRRRSAVFNEAATKAIQLNRPLVVIGAPDGGVTSGYQCGTYTVDISPTACPNWLPVDITKTLPFGDNSVVVFCSCVLEYVVDPSAAVAEIKRVTGGYAYFVGVEPWTLAGLSFPGAKQTMPPALR
jgi:methyltransferase family protein